MDARGELRRLLRQRLEDGETTIVLESLTATQVGAALKASSETQIPRVARDDTRARDDKPARGDTAAQDDKRETLEQRRTIPAEGSGDWRAALRSNEKEMPSPKAPAAPRAGKVVVTP